MGFKRKILLLLLGKEAVELGESFKKSGISGAHVVGRGTIVVEATEIAKTNEFRELQKVAKRIIKDREIAC